MAIKFNTEPYWDDFIIPGPDGLSPKEKYQRILFRPGKAIQARELTQLQTSLQHQISSVGDHLFKDGSVVVPGTLHLHNKIDYVKLSGALTGIADSTAAELIGTEFSDTATPPNRAEVVHAELATGTDETTIWIKSTFGTTFAAGVGLTATGKTATVKSADATGYGSIVAIEAGIYYINKHMVTVPAKTIILSKYTHNVSADIGLLVTEQLIASGTDASLTDNATGSPNATAPGAHRYSITAVLSTQTVNAALGNFVLIARIEDGVITKNARGPDYNFLADELARRTFDESGNYYVNPFKALVKDHVASTPDETKLTIAIEPSKAYVRGYEIETLGTTNVAFDKARDIERVTDKVIEITHNNYMEVTSMSGVPDITTYGKISVLSNSSSLSNIVNYNSTVAGTIKATSSSPGLVTGDAISILDTTSYNGQYTITKIDANNFYFTDTYVTNETAGIIAREIGTCRARSIERVSGNGATVASRYRVHIFDYVDNTAGKTGMSTATHVDDKEGTAAGANFAATIADSGAATAYNIGPDSLVYELPYSRIKTLNTITSGVSVDYNCRYETNRIVGSTTVSVGLTATFTAGGTGEQFGSRSSNSNWILINDTDTTVGGEEILPANIAIDNSTSPPSVVISNISATADSDIVRLIAPIIRTVNTEAELKTKTLTTNLSPFSTFGVNTDFTGSGQALDHADIYELVSIVETGTSPEVIVTDHFNLDNGQRDDYYDVGRISLKTTSNYPAAVALTVKYKYFTHGAGDFFTVDSYVGVDFADIPKLGDIELRSAVDFRPRVSDAGGNFTGSGRSTSSAPVRYSQFETDIQFYLPRIDKVYLDSKGKFGISPGVPSRTPAAPDVPSDSMHLYTLTIPAYTLNTDEVNVEFIDQRRYTMRDIGRIDNRLSQVEYYSVLNFLETEAQNKQILDTSNNPRWKSGYLVDGFSNTRMSKSWSPEYRAAIDIPNRTLRPAFAQGHAELKYDTPASSTRKTGDLVTLPYTPAPIITQTQYSGQINVNPYNVFNWTGSMKLTPSTDTWRDIDRRPQVTINNDGEFDAMMKVLEPQVGTVWGEWSTNWSGTPTWQNVNRTRGRRQQKLVQTGTKSRSGVTSKIEVITSKFTVGDRIVEVNFVPFMRTRLVSFEARRLKPGVQVYAFFDDISVADYVSTTDSTYKPLVGVNTVSAHPNGATTLITDDNGAVSGTFLIPNNSTLNFKTGDKEFKLTQSSTNDDEVTDTSAVAMYTATGLIETVENVVVSTRMPYIQRYTAGTESVGDSRETAPRRWIDPLAQSIIFDKTLFVTSVELFFTSKDTGTPVQVQIVKMSNGFPTQTVIPFADTTVNPSAVNIDGTSTTFTFDSPVLLQDATEYAIVVISSSNKYNVRYAQIGDEDQNGNRISQQPYPGVMFKSQNASTWSPDQNKDLAFIVNRAVFDISAPRTCVLKNDLLASRALVKHPLLFAISTASADNTFTVSHRDHGMKTGNTVGFAGVADTNGYGFFTTATAATAFVIGTQYKIGAVGSSTQAQWEIAGVPSGTTAAADVVFTAIAQTAGTGTAYPHELNKVHTIVTATIDSYTILVTAANHADAITAGIGGGEIVEATQYLAWNTIHPVIQNIVLPTTTQTWTIKDTLMSGGSITTVPAAVIINEDYSPLSPKVVKSGATETLQFEGNFTSYSDYISPVVDLERCSVITVGNRIDNNDGAVAETDPSKGSTLAKYVTKTVELQDTSDGIKVFLDINRPNNTFVDVYYKTGNTAGTFDAESWILTTPPNGVSFSDGFTFDETTYTITPVADFTIFALKIVMRSASGTSNFPSCQGLRAIALKV